MMTYWKNGDQIDLLAEELEKANCVNRLETSISPSSETNSKKRDSEMIYRSFKETDIKKKR